MATCGNLVRQCNVDIFLILLGTTLVMYRLQGRIRDFKLGGGAVKKNGTEWSET